MPDPPHLAYGATRERGANLSHAEIERAALDLLTAGTRPSVALIRAQLKRGSAATIASSLKRFWRDLGARAQGDPAALTRLPSDIADLADGLWQRALALAAQAAKQDDNAARERLARIRIENEVRAQSFELREKEFETSARERERALADSRDHLLSTLRMLEADRVALRARDARIADLEAQIEDYRRQLTTIVDRELTRNRKQTQRRPGPLVTGRSKSKSQPVALRSSRQVAGAASSRYGRKPKSKRRAKR